MFATFASVTETCASGPCFSNFNTGGINFPAGEAFSSQPACTANVTNQSTPGAQGSNGGYFVLTGSSTTAFSVNLGNGTSIPPGTQTIVYAVTCVGS